MEPFTTLKAVAIPIDLAHVDTDCIIPARFLRRVRAEYCKAMFHDLRIDGDGNPTDFVFNNPAYKNAQILVADTNFGCGSSRESAVWALAEHDGSVLERGIRCVIAPSFGDIFFSNCCQNGVLALRLTKSECDSLRDELRADVGVEMQVDLNEQTVTSPKGNVYKFEIDPDRKHSLLNGLDEISFTEARNKQIQDYEAARKQARPWLP